MAQLTFLDLREARQALVAEAAAMPALQAVKENLYPTLYGLSGGDLEDPTFRRLTSPNTIRDLAPLMHTRMQEIAFYLKATTPFGKRIVEVISDYVVGEGFTPTAEDEAAQEVINSFWKDPINKMARNLRDFCDELTTFGELCIPVIVNPVDGSVRLGYVDPQRIESIEHATLVSDADGGSVDANFPVAVRLRRRIGEPEGKRLEVIRLDDDPNSPTFGQLKGDCFYWSINKAKGASRGLSELFSLADWIDVFDKMMFDFADRVQFLNAFVWHYTLTGADDKKVTEFAKKTTQNPPRTGGFQVTNDQVKITPLTPQLQGADMSQVARFIKLYGLGGAGLPAWFFADPVDANRSTADEMTGPTGKKLTERQNHLKFTVGEILAFVVQQAIYHGVLPQSVNAAVTLQVPDLMIKDLQKAAATMGAATNSLSIAEENGWIQSETAARAFHVVLSQLGVEVDSKDEFKKAQAEKQQRQAQQINDLMPQKNLANALDQLDQQQGGGAVQ